MQTPQERCLPETEVPDYYVKDGVAVDPNYHWRSMETCPPRVKVQVLTKGGIATHAIIIDGKNAENYVGWTPLPKRS